MERLLSVKQLAERWGVSKGHLYNIYKDSNLPFFKIKGNIRFRLKDVLEFEYARRDENILDLELPDDSMKMKGVPTMGKSHSWNFKNGCSIYQQPTKNGGVRFKLSYYDNQGKRIQRVAKDAKSFEEAFQQLQQKLRELQESPERKKGKTSFSVFCDEFRENYMMIERRNWKPDAYRLEILKDHFRNVPIDEITSQMVRNFKQERIDVGNKAGSVNRYLALLKKMMNVAIENELIDRNPVKPVRMRKEQNKNHRKILTQEEEQRLLAECHPRLKPIVIIAINTGMRKSEIMNLTWNNVDPLNDLIIVENTKSDVARDVPINDAVKEQILMLRQSRNGNEKIFPFKSIRTAWENAKRRAEINIRFHDLRHTCATRLVQAGVDIVTVKEVLGHSSLAITQIYLHSSQNRKRDALNRICSKSCSKKVEQVSTNPENRLESMN